MGLGAAQTRCNGMLTIGRHVHLHTQFGAGAAEAAFADHGQRSGWRGGADFYHGLKANRMRQAGFQRRYVNDPGQRRIGVGLRSALQLLGAEIHLRTGVAQHPHRGHRRDGLALGPAAQALQQLA